MTPPVWSDKKTTKNKLYTEKYYVPTRIFRTHTMCCVVYIHLPPLPHTDSEFMSAYGSLNIHISIIIKKLIFMIII